MHRSALIAILLTFACNNTAPTKKDLTPDTPDAPATPKQQPKTKPPPATKVDATGFSDELKKLNASIDALEKRATQYPKQWVHIGRLAGLYSTRARLTGNYDDYALAEKSLDRAFETAAKGSGPFLARAQLNYTLHRLDRIEADLDQADKRIVKDKNIQSAHAGMRANLAFQRGQYTEAQSGFAQALELRKTPTNLAQLALYYWKTGDYDRAESLYREADALYKGNAAEPKAWLYLQMGLMDLDRGRYADALAHYQEAGQKMPGYWLVDEHIAEIKTLTGKTEEAKQLYIDIIARTGNPEFMDALAGIYLEEGAQQEADALLKRAQEVYEKQLKQFPEAAYGHALEHYLEFGQDPARVVQIAEANHTTRPNATAKILLAQAYLKAKRPDDAVRIIEQALALAWRSSELHDTAADVYEATGDAKKAAEQRKLARAINPKGP